MKSTSKNTRREFSDHEYTGLQSYIEEHSLTNDIEQILSQKHRFRRIKALTALHTRYTSPLSHGHIDYYIRQQTRALSGRLLGIVCALLIAAYFAFALYKINIYYQKYYHLNVSDVTFQKAVDYYEDGDYQAALLRFQRLYDNELNSTSSAHHLSSIYSQQENYDAAASILLDYLTNRCGLANISTDNTIYAELRELSLYKPLSGQIADEVSDAFDLISSCSAQYIQLFAAIREQNYTEADYLCENLKSVSADGYYFVSCYSDVLVNTNRIEDAYNLIMETVRNDSNPRMRMITARQRTSLVNYIMPYLNEDGQSACNKFLTDELPELTIVSDSDSAEPFLPYEDAEYLFNINMSVDNLRFRNSLDRTVVHEETMLVNAKEVYYIELLHRDGIRMATEYFIMDMKQNISIFMDDKYTLLPTDEPSNPPAELSGTVYQRYTLYENPDIVLEFQYDEDPKDPDNPYTIKNVSSGEVLYSGPPAGQSTYGAFAYLQIDRAYITVFLGVYDAVILVTKDPDHAFAYLEGRYLNESPPSEF